jgi:hypothetical protein
VILVRAEYDAASGAEAEGELRTAVAGVEVARRFSLTNVVARPAPPPRAPQGGPGA